MNENLNYFIGKYCTITTVQINYRFKYEQMVDYFMGRVDAIDESGILVTHPTTNSKNYIFLSHIVSIAEEQYTEDPEIIEKYKKEKPVSAAKTAIPVPEDNTPYVNPTGMAELAKRAREAFK